MGGDKGTDTPTDGAKWYELFSRGARDWLRHDEKVREAVRRHLPQAVAGGELISGGARTVRVKKKEKIKMNDIGKIKY
jgi:hypothetical protein